MKLSHEPALEAQGGIRSRGGWWEFRAAKIRMETEIRQFEETCADKIDYTDCVENGTLRLDQIMEVTGHQVKKYGLHHVDNHESSKGCEHKSTILGRFDLVWP